jgi:hypothetical protein
MSIAFVNNEIAGAFEPFPKPITRQVNKKFDSTAGTDKEWIRGFIYAKDPADLTTQTEYVLAKATAKKPFVVSVDTRRKAVSGTSYLQSGNDFTNLGALQSDPLTNALFYGYVCVYVDGIVKPDNPVMPSDGTTTHTGVAGVLGHVQAWDGVSERAIVGKYLSRIGQSGGKWIRTATPDVTGTLAKIWIGAPT